ncbi:endonuclease domain-containing protein [Chroococcidiopsis thermalis]|jgi:very-short-patch-repair endonuclease|uniref:DUF559 domain-containing protein n=2 Tax=Chroococcidiopsis TaxID=54298 RepID=K9U1Q5_CHRTP|nr:endonuclease domain-containing protein [Chroococcidiopsis thermalis]AFY88351.1 hypothetical protein Chro_2883 [Chroococcidiopsis thermalis PCC 7203]PSB42365.1 DUF559 domain-containing protein [Cyanosarcina cf. burmensis CCALA 770]
MTKLYNKTSEQEKRRSLRKNMPLAEKMIWSKLRCQQIDNCKFRRQYSIDAFVIDFYSTEFKLAIEIDGDSHYQDGVPNYDRERQVFLEATGAKVLRFTNREVYENLNQVLEVVSQAIRQLRKYPLPNPPLAKGRELESSSLGVKGREKKELLTRIS